MAATRKARSRTKALAFQNNNILAKPPWKQGGWFLPLMKGACLMSVLLMGIPSLSLSWGKATQLQELSYNIIVERNAFGLKSPTAPLVQQTNPPRSRPELRLTGIAVIGTNQWAYLTAEDRVNPVRYYSFQAGGQRDGIRLLAINLITKTVEILERGQYRLLTFEPYEEQAKRGRELQQFVEEHISAHELRQIQETERELEELRNSRIAR